MAAEAKTGVPEEQEEESGMTPVTLLDKFREASPSGKKRQQHTRSSTRTPAASQKKQATASKKRVGPPSTPRVTGKPGVPPQAPSNKKAAAQSPAKEQTAAHPPQPPQPPASEQTAAQPSQPQQPSAKEQTAAHPPQPPQPPASEQTATQPPQPPQPSAKEQTAAHPPQPPQPPASEQTAAHPPQPPQPPQPPASEQTAAHLPQPPQPSAKEQTAAHPPQPPQPPASKQEAQQTAAQPPHPPADTQTAQPPADTQTAEQAATQPVQSPASIVPALSREGSVMCVDFGTMNTIVTYAEDTSPDSVIEVSKCTASEDARSCATTSVLFINGVSESGVMDYSLERGNDQSIGLYALKLLAFRRNSKEVEHYALDVNYQNNPRGYWVLDDNDDADGLNIEVRFGDVMHSVTPETALRILMTMIIKGNEPAVGDLRDLAHLVFTIPNVQPTSVSQMYREIGTSLCPRAEIHFLREPQAAFIQEYYNGSFDNFRGNVLVFDMGDGTLDLAVMRVEAGDCHKRKRKSAVSSSSAAKKKRRNRASSSSVGGDDREEEVEEDEAGARSRITCHMLHTAFSSVCGGKSYTMRLHEVMQKDMEEFVAKSNRQLHEDSYVTERDAARMKEGLSTLLTRANHEYVSPCANYTNILPAYSGVKKLLKKCSVDTKTDMPSFLKEWNRSRMLDVMKAPNDALRGWLEKTRQDLGHTRIDRVMLVGGGVLCYGVKDVILDTMRVRGVAVRTAAYVNDLTAVSKGGVAMPKIMRQAKEVHLDGRTEEVSRFIGRTVTSMSYGFVYLDKRNVERVRVIVPINARLPVPFTTNDSEDAPDILANDMRKHGSDGRWSMRVAVLESAELVDGAKFDDAIRQKCHVVDVDAVAKCKADGKRFKMFMAVNGEGTVIDIRMEIQDEPAGNLDIIANTTV